MRYKNAVENMRNIFAFDGQVMIVSSYSKTMAMTGQEKVIPRFLLTSIGQLWVAYLETVPALIRLLDRAYLPKKLQSILWADSKGLWDTNRATKAMTEATSTCLGVRFTFQDYRHVAKGIDREHIRPGGKGGASSDSDDEDEEDDTFDLAYRHSRGTASDVYGIDQSMLRDLNTRTIHAFRAIAARWHRFLELPS